MKLEERDLRAAGLPSRLPLVLAIIGAVAFILGIVIAPQRAWLNFLLVNYFLLGLGLAAMLFIAIQYSTGASWCVVLRRIPEAMSAILPCGALGMILIILLQPSIYAWTQGLGEHTSAALSFKRAWLSWPFFLLRALIYLSAWLLVSRSIVRHSRRQDEDGADAHTTGNIRRSVVFIAVFSLTFWLASYDWIMSLDFHWSSTIFGVYNFAGLFQSGLAVIILLVIWQKKRGPLKFLITAEHLHDLAKLLFAFSTFWMYIWFSQYMLIWFADNPEETSYFITRVKGYYQPLFILDMVLNWVIPFIVLLPRWTKRNPSILAKVCFVVLAGRWLDLYLMIMPSSSPQRPVFGFWELGILAGGAGLFMIIFSKALIRVPILPLNDPLLSESLHHHQ